MDKKHAYSFIKFLEIERRKIDEDKFFAGIRTSSDPGEEYIVDWIKRNAKMFRCEWEESCCKHCKHWKVCGHRILKKCTDFENDPEENDECE